MHLAVHRDCPVKVKTWNNRDGIVKVKCEVEDHGNGFMVIGTNLPDEARKVLAEYVDNLADYAFAGPTRYNGRSACWLTDHPGHYWEGSTWVTGEPMPRVNYTN